MANYDLGDNSFKHRISSVAVIGAGPSGIAAAKYLFAEKVFNKIDVFEQRNRVGGIWNYKSSGNASTTIPQTEPQQPLEEPSWRHLNHENGSHEASEPVFDSAIYDSLETNIPHTLMQYAEKPFPTDSALFPGHEAVLHYLEEYAEDVQHLIKFETQVLGVSVHSQDLCNWEVTTQHLQGGKPSTSIYDAIVVANGHYIVPYVPNIKGITEWYKAYPGSISHSKSYRNNKPFIKRKVIIVGNSASGIDIAAQVQTVCQQPLLCSQRSESIFAPEPTATRRDMCEIAEFLSPVQYDRGVRFIDGTIEEQVDHVLCATGYFYSYPFLSSLKPPIITSGRRTNNIYKQIFHTEYPTLAFTILPLKIIPFPLAENQAAVMARVWSGRLSLPSRDIMRAEVQKRIEEYGNDGGFHYLKFPQDANYLNELYDWARAAPSDPGSGLVNDGVGKVGTRWNEKICWAREKFPAIRKAYQNRGSERVKVRTIEELGFNFEEWKREQELGSKKLL